MNVFQLDLYRRQLLALHNHICPRQILGLRMGLLGSALLKVEVPQTSKRLLAFVETNGCFADGLSVATGCSLGHRTLYLMDYGKVATTLVDVQMGQALRIAPHPNCRSRAILAVTDARNNWEAYLRGYPVLEDQELLVVQAVELNFSLQKLISQAGLRVQCDECGEEILNEREVEQDGRVLCRACAGEAYYVSSALKIAMPSGSQAK